MPEGMAASLRLDQTCVYDQGWLEQLPLACPTMPFTPVWRPGRSPMTPNRPWPWCRPSLFELGQLPEMGENGC
jgi:hypothetical protein